MISSISLEFVRTRTVDGVLLHGALTGRGSREGFLGVHGAWGNFYGTPVFDLLEVAPRHGLAALSLNNRGHDLGSLGDGEPCIGLIRERFEDTLADLDAAADVITRAGVERMVCVAHSFGAHKASYWMGERQPAQVSGLVLLSPGPRLQSAEKWFVDGPLDRYLELAEQAIGEGEPQRLIVLSSNAPVPMVAQASTVISIWGHDTIAASEQHLPSVTVPVLVTVGEREPGPYKDKAETVAASAPDHELIVLPDDHYYSHDRAGLWEVVLDWVRRRGLLDLDSGPAAPPTPSPAAGGLAR